MKNKTKIVTAAATVAVMNLLPPKQVAAEINAGVIISQVSKDIRPIGTSRTDKASVETAGYAVIPAGSGYFKVLGMQTSEIEGDTKFATGVFSYGNKIGPVSLQADYNPWSLLPEENINSIKEKTGYDICVNININPLENIALSANVCKGMGGFTTGRYGKMTIIYSRELAEKLNIKGEIGVLGNHEYVVENSGISAVQGKLGINGKIGPFDVGVEGLVQKGFMEPIIRDHIQLRTQVGYKFFPR